MWYEVMALQSSSLPLHEVIPLKSFAKRFTEVLVLLLLSLVAYRILSFNGNFRIAWLVACACEACFAFIWAMVVNIKWSPVDHKTYPDRLLQSDQDLPPVDIFVTTADPELEPPIITVNTVLSLLAVDYEPHKLACYVSDDAGSPITLYSLIQTSEFAKHWVPFCKKYKIQVRAPFRYFATQVSLDGESLEFQQEWQDMKNKYDQLNFRVEEACKSEKELDSKEFMKMTRCNHDSIVKVIRENKGVLDGLPHLIYVVREKRPMHPHHYKAGAMNVLTRVSGVMTNAPFMLNVDCDMFINDPQTFHRAMCLLLGYKSEYQCAYVQFPQVFYNGLKDDPFGNQLVVMQKKLAKGIGGIQGALYGGTGCFHRRKIIYGLLSDQNFPVQLQSGYSSTPTTANPDQAYGKSLKLINSMDAARPKSTGHSILDSVDAAHQVAGCNYESGTKWGINIGWIYGSATEDILTGLTIHSRGYKSIYYDPDPPSFMGCAPLSGPITITQVKRWATGLLEIFFSSRNPIILSFTSNLQLRQSLTYTWIFIWGLRSFPELCYSLLPAYCILSNSALLPKVDKLEWLLVVVMLFIIYNLYTLTEYFECGLSTRSWWNNQRAWRIYSSTAWLFGVIRIVLKLLGLSETVFEVTKKGEPDAYDGPTDKISGRFTFDESPIFIPATALVMVNLVAIALGFFRIIWAGINGQVLLNVEYGAGELGCCIWMLLMFSPFVRGLFGKGKYGIPTVTILKSMVLALGLLSFVL